MKLILALALAIMNPTYSPDSTKIAYTKANDLYVKDVATEAETRLTFDGSDLILNGYASWVYYEEIFGRSSNYRAFWWSPDSRKIAFYRFDNGAVPMFPIYSPFGAHGTLSRTRYPKAGDTNPSVRIGFIDLDSCEGRSADAADCSPCENEILWAEFDYSEDQYFGTPFWGSDSRELYVQRMPRRQSVLDLYAVSAADGSRRQVYHEEYPTWINWIDGMLFTDKGLYMVRDFESGWEQIYFLGFDGSLKCLTEGRNWDVSLLKVDSKRGDLWFMAKRDSRLHPTLYRLDKKGVVTALTDPEYYAASPRISDDFKTFTAVVSNARVPSKTVRGDARKGLKAGFVVVDDMASKVDAAAFPSPQVVRIENDGFDLYGLISYPRGFDPSGKYPVVMQLYGGPGTPYVRDRWNDRDAQDRWCWENGIIYIVVDPRSSGENGRRGMDQAFRRMTVIELQDYLAWARWLKSFDYVTKIGVEGFSFGGTTTAMLVMSHPEWFCCGIAGGGVYDWRLYDSHYTERFMDTPQANPDGYAEASPLNFVSSDSGYLKLTHGTGDDNVHFQNTLQMIDALQKKNVQFDLMIYPDGMHGYRGYQKQHSDTSDHAFWSAHLY